MWVYYRCHGNVVKGYLALLDIYDCVLTTFDFPVIIDGQLTSFIFRCKFKASVVAHAFYRNNFCKIFKNPITKCLLIFSTLTQISCIILRSLI
jgi:hypothetical protein